MKRYIRNLFSVALASLCLAGLVSCEGDQATPPLPLPEGLFNQNGEIGQGTWECPLTVWQARIGTKPTGMTDNVWVSGYIVGWVNTGASLVMQESSCVFEAPASTSGNILLSDYTPQELWDRFVEKEEELDQEGVPTGRVTILADHRWEHCCPVDLVYDSEPRSVISLTGSNASNLGKRVSVMGETNLKKYGVFGVKFVSAYNWGPQGKVIEPAVPGIFEKVTQFTPDRWYVVAAPKQNVWYAAKTLEAERDYLGKTQVSIISGRIDIANVNVNAFYFEKVGDGVRIRMHNGRYLCIDGVDKAFHTTGNPDETICMFSVQENADGTFTIKSKANGTMWMYDTGYESYGLYSSPGADNVYPTLFILLD